MTRNLLILLSRKTTGEPNRATLLVRWWPKFVSNRVAGISNPISTRRYANADELLSWFEGWAEKQPGGQPIFAYVHFLDPHAPYDPPSEYRSKFKVAQDVSASIPDPGAWSLSPFDAASELPPSELEDVISLYDGEIAHADWATGQLLELLRSKGWYEDALIIVTSDHGEEFGDHGNWEHNRSLFEEVLHVPLLIRFPGGFMAENRLRQIVRLLDIFPTVLDVLGLEPLDDMRGSSLLQSISEEEGEASFGHVDKGPGGWSISVRTDRYKYILAERDGDRTEMVYDMAADPLEKTNLIGQEGVPVDALREMAQLHAKQAEEGAIHGTQRSVNARAGKALRELGYLD